MRPSSARTPTTKQPSRPSSAMSNNNNTKNLLDARRSSAVSATSSVAVQNYFRNSAAAAHMKQNNNNHHHHSNSHTDKDDEHDAEADALLQLNAVDPRVAYTRDLQNWGSHLVRLCADGATAKKFPFLLDFEHAEPPPLFNELVYYLPSERRHGVDHRLRRAGTINLACAELHDPREELDAEIRQEHEKKEKEAKQREKEEAEAKAVVAVAAAAAGSSSSATGEEETGKKSPEPSPAMPTGGFMLHATLFLQLRILNHTYYLAPVDVAHREAVKKHIRRWIASARGPISAQTGHLLLRYAVTIPRPSVRKQIQKIVDKARKELFAQSTNSTSQNSNANNNKSPKKANGNIFNQFELASALTSATTHPTENSLPSDENNNNCGQQLHQKNRQYLPLEAPVIDFSSKQDSEEPSDDGTDGLSSAQFIFRDPFLCVVDESVSVPANTTNNNMNSIYGNNNSRRASSAFALPSSQNNNNQQSSSSATAVPMNARVEHAPPLATIEQELLHGITMREHQNCCCPHRMDLPDLLQDGWGASVRASLNTNKNQNTTNNQQQHQNQQNSGLLQVPGISRISSQAPYSSQQSTSNSNPDVDLSAFFEPPKMEEKTIHGALQIPHPFGRSLSFSLVVRHNTHGKLKAYSANSLLEPLFSNQKKRKQFELSMESSFNMSSNHNNSKANSNRSTSSAYHQRPQDSNTMAYQQYATAPATIFINQLLTSCTAVDNCLLVLLVSPSNSSSSSSSSQSRAKNRRMSTSGMFNGNIPERLRIIGWARIWIEPVLHPSLTLAVSVTNMFRKHFYPCDPMVRLQRKSGRELVHNPVGSNLPPSNWLFHDENNENNNDGNNNMNDNPLRFIPRPPPATNLLHQTSTVFVSEAYHNKPSAMFRYCDFRLPFSCVSCQEGKPVAFADAVPAIFAAWSVREQQWLSKKTKDELLTDREQLAKLEKIHYGSTAAQQLELLEKQRLQQETQIAEKRKKRRKLGAFVFIGTSSDTEEEERELQEAKARNARDLEARRQSADNATLSGTQFALANTARRRSSSTGGGGAGGLGATKLAMTLQQSQAILGQIEQLTSAAQDHRLMLSAHFPYAMILPVRAQERKRAMAEGVYWYVMSQVFKTISDNNNNNSNESEETNENSGKKKIENKNDKSAFGAAFATTATGRSKIPSSSTAVRKNSNLNNSDSNQDEKQMQRRRAILGSTATVYATVHDEFVIEVLDLLFDPTDGSTKPSVIGTSAFSLESLLDAFSAIQQQQLLDQNSITNSRQNNAASYSPQRTINGLQPIKWHKDLEHPQGQYIDVLLPPPMIELEFSRRTAFDDLHSRLRTSLDSGKPTTFSFADRLISFHPTHLKQDQSQISQRFLQEKKDRFKKTSVNVGIVGQSTAEESFARLFDRNRSGDNSRGVWDIGAMFVVDFCAGSSAAHNRRTFLDGSNMVRGVLRLISTQLYPYTGWCELTACTTNPVDRQLTLQTLQRVDDNSYPNAFAEEQPFIDPCVDLVYETPRGVSDLLKAYDQKVNSISGGGNNANNTSMNNQYSGRRGTSVGNNNSNSNVGLFGELGGNALSGGIQMPFFLTPALRHARKMAKQRAQQEVDMDKKEAEHLEEKKDRKNKKKNNNQKNQQQQPAIAVSDSEWFGDHTIVEGEDLDDDDDDDDENEQQQQQEEDVPLFPGLARRRFFVTTVIVAGSEIADAKNAAKLLDEMQGEPIVIFLVVLRKSQMKQKQQQLPTNSNNNNIFNSYDPASAQNNNNNNASFQNAQNAMFEAQLREFQNKWNVIVTVLDISPDPADVHENFDRLAMSVREIPKVFISTARCLSHGPKGLRPAVTKESVLMFQARKKQKQLAKLNESPTNNNKGTSNHQQENQNNAVKSPTTKRGKNSRNKKGDVQDDEIAEHEEECDEFADQELEADLSDGAKSKNRRKRQESAVTRRLRLLQKPEDLLEPALNALRGALDENWDAYHPPQAESPNKSQQQQQEPKFIIGGTGTLSTNPEEGKKDKTKSHSKKSVKYQQGAIDKDDQKKVNDGNDDEHPEHALEFTGGRSRTRSAMIASSAGTTLHEDAETLRKRQAAEEEEEENADDEPGKEDENEHDEEFMEEEEFAEEEEEEDEQQIAEDAYHEGKDRVTTRLKKRGPWGTDHVSIKIFDPYAENQGDDESDDDDDDQNDFENQNSENPQKVRKEPRRRRMGTTTTSTSSSGGEDDDEENQQKQTDSLYTSTLKQRSSLNSAKEVVTVLGPSSSSASQNKTAAKLKMMANNHNYHPVCDTSVTLVDVFVEELESSDEDF